jgi:cytochrome c oxidase subunit III
MTPANTAGVPPQYHDKAQRDAANQLGMWTLIATELLFFGGLFLAYFIYRLTYPAAFSAGSRLLDFWSGTVNTAVLLTSSLTMALADAMIKRGRRRAMALLISCTAVLGALFLAVKFREYSGMYRDHLVPGVNFSAQVSPQAELFVFLYFVMTGLHALHMVIGIGAMVWLLVIDRRGVLSGSAHAPVVMVGLYWHFVDCVWVFLYPLLYLIPAHR